MLVVARLSSSNFHPFLKLLRACKSEKLENWDRLIPLHRSLKNYQYSTEGQKFHENLAPVLAIISGNYLAFSRKIITIILLVFTGAVPQTRQHQLW